MKRMRGGNEFAFHMGTVVFLYGTFSMASSRRFAASKTVDPKFLG
jgi:hypothetical protein